MTITDEINIPISNDKNYFYQDEICPKCGKGGCLMDLGDEDIEKLWKDFGDIPINDDDEIDVDFHFWEKGTDKMEIWHWFDENHSTGINYLMKL